MLKTISVCTIHPLRHWYQSEMRLNAHLHEVSSIPIVIDPTGVESCACPFPTKSRYQGQGGHCRRTICRWSRQSHGEHTHITLDSQDLSRRSGVFNGMEILATDNKLTAIQIFAFVRVKSFSKIQKTLNNILVPDKPFIECSNISCRRRVPR